MAVALAPPLTRALVVPDAAHWAAAGVNLAELGIEPTWTPAGADAVVVSAALPETLADAVREALVRLREPGAVRALAEAVVPGEPVEGLLAPGADREHGHEHAHAHEHEHEYGGGGEHAQDHHEMMAVTGEPSRDGLVMEEIETVLGPLAPSLPTGILVRMRLDGDVVAEAAVEAGLAAPATDGAPDPLARAAWAWARARAASGPSLAPALVARHLAATEVERALSHLTWLARFGRLLGWLELAEACERDAGPLIAAHRALSIQAAGVEPRDLSPRPLERVAALLSRPRTLERRTRGLAHASQRQCRRRGLSGPLARASGLADDVRSADPAYRALGFAAVLAEGGDAEARTRLRAEEAVAAVRLAAAALEAGELPGGDERAVEGPRGPLAVGADGEEGGAARAAGSAAARELAGELAQELELADALVAIASFDLSPWAVDG